MERQSGVQLNEIQPVEHFYTWAEIAAICEKLLAKGYDVDGGELNGLTIHDLDVLANAGPN
jgi:hypothetical protein